MSVGALTWTALIVLFVLGAAPVFVVRLAARIYPKGHPRRNELVAEMQHVAGLRMALARWYWMSETVALAVCEGTAARFARRIRRAPLAYLVLQPGKVTVTMRQGQDRMHFDFEQGPNEERLLERSNPEHAAQIAELDRRRKRERRWCWIPRPVRNYSALALFLIRINVVLPLTRQRRQVRVLRPAGRHRAHARTSAFRLR